MKSNSSKPRNLLHDHPLLRKGGAHGKTKKAERRRDTQALRKAWSSLNTLGVLREGHAGWLRISVLHT